MRIRSKSYRNTLSGIDQKKVFSLEEGIVEVKKLKRAKFEESVELHLSMNLKGTKGPQSVRGTLVFVKSVGKIKRVAVFSDIEGKLKEAKDAGAEMVGGKELIEQVKKDGTLDVDIVIATPEFMRSFASVARILGPKGLMPSPKNETVTDDISKAVKEFKAGKVEFKMDKTSNMHQIVGKVSFEDAEIIKNVQDLVQEIKKNKPEKVKGEFIKRAYLCLTQSPSVPIKL